MILLQSNKITDILRKYTTERQNYGFTSNETDIA